MRSRESTPLANRGEHLLLGDLLALEVLLHDRVVEVSEGLDELGTVLLDLVLEMIGAVLDAHGLAVVAVEVVGLAVEQVDDALVVVLGADRVVDHDALCLSWYAAAR